ncbi:MAG: hemolysin family protein [Bacteroidales bacterium]|jgi:CBS domain containing-hemolysin-like protein
MYTSISLAVASLVIMAIFTALERAFRCYNMLRVEVDKKQGKVYAESVDRLSQEKGEVIASFRVGRTISLLVFSLSLAAVFDPLLSQFVDMGRGMVIAIEIAGITLIVLTAAVLVPFAVSTRNPNRILESFYWFASISYAILSPLAKKIVKREGIVMEEPGKDIAIFQNALNFSDVILRECMVPRTEICSIAEDATFEELLAQFADSNYSRIIVYRESIDRIIGYVHSRDLFNGKKPINELIREIDYLPETMSAQSLLTILTKSKRSIAVVLDEYGGTAGIVTLEDLIEEIFGEISDELDKEELIEKRISDNEFVFSARIEIKYLNRIYGLEIPESEDYETLAGFITFFHENIPSEGDVLEYGNMFITILKTTSNRVEKVELRIDEE